MGRKEKNQRWSPLPHRQSATKIRPMIPDRLLKILRSCEDVRTSHFPPTEVFNEGWMLRLVLDAVQTLELDDSPFRFLDGSAWYSEALLSSPFRPRSRGDKL